MGAILSSYKSKRNNDNKNQYESTPDVEIDNVDTDGKTYLQYIMNYDSIPYFIPEIKYAKVTDIRPDYTIVVAARFPNKDSPIHRFPIRLKHVVKEFVTFKPRGDLFESNLDTKAVKELFPLICGSIVELKDIENNHGMLYADVYYEKKRSVSEWLVENNLAVDIDHKFKLVPAPVEKLISI